jgi:RNA polymerase sigma-70 factor (ECF subfamily)
MSTVQVAEPRRMDRHEFDADYIERLRAGDVKVETHFAAYFGQLIALKARRYRRPPTFAEDVRQETFLRVLRALRTPPGIVHPERFGAFVHSVCERVLLEFQRQEMRHPPVPEHGGELADPLPSPEAQVLSEDGKEYVRSILRRLPEKERCLLSAVFLDEAEKDEVCRRLGVDRDYLRVLLHRAKLVFKAWYVRQNQPTP